MLMLNDRMVHVFHPSDFLDDEYITMLIQLMYKYPARKYYLFHEQGNSIHEQVFDKLYDHGILPEDYGQEHFDKGASFFRHTLKLSPALKRDLDKDYNLKAKQKFLL